MILVLVLLDQDKRTDSTNGSDALLKGCRAFSYDTGIDFGVYVACASQMMNQDYREYKTLPAKVAFASL